MGLDIAYHDIHAAILYTMPLLEHLISFTGTRGIAQVDLE
jgi:hypothetical protein